MYLIGQRLHRYGNVCFGWLRCSGIRLAPTAAQGRKRFGALRGGERNLPHRGITVPSPKRPIGFYLTRVRLRFRRGHPELTCENIEPTFVIPYRCQTGITLAQISRVDARFCE